MKNLTYDDIEYKQVHVSSEIPKVLESQINTINITEGKCLSNSLSIAEKCKDVELVEGFLVTHFENGHIECVGHVWNIIKVLTLTPQ